MFPKDFLAKYKQILKKWEFEKFKASCHLPLRKSIRVNTLKISVKDFKVLTKKNWWILSQIPWCKAWFWIDREDRSEPLWKSYLHTCGYFYIQEASSMLPPEILSPSKWEMVLDLSASPWSKATQMADMMENNWLLLANEIDPKRLMTMKTNLDRLWVLNYLITEKDWMVFSQYFPNYFDKVLVDAPCTGEWTIRKDKSALDYWSQKAIQKLASLQKRLLIEAFHSLKKGGEMVYSTCTLAPEEDEEVISYLLETFPDKAEIIPIKEKWIIKKKNEFWLDWVLRVWPQDYDTEGFFVAKIRKLEETQSDFYAWIKPWHRKSPFVKIKKVAKSPLSKFLKNKKEKIKNIWQKWDEIYIRPNGVEEVVSKISSTCSWILIWKTNKKWEFDFTYEWAFALEKYLNFRNIEIGPNELKDLLKWSDLKSSGIKDSFVFFEYSWLSVWFGKVVWDKIKNKIPKYLICN